MREQGQTNLAPDSPAPRSSARVVHVPTGPSDWSHQPALVVITRAGVLLGVDTRGWPATTHPFASIEDLARTRAGAELLATALLPRHDACPDCAGTAHAQACRAEWDVVWAALTGLADRAARSLGMHVASLDTAGWDRVRQIGLTRPDPTDPAETPGRLRLVEARPSPWTYRPPTPARPGPPVWAYLLERTRDRLSRAATEHLSHALPGAETLWLALDGLEDRIRRDTPNLWGQNAEAWLAHDGARLHDGWDDTTGDCQACASRRLVTGHSGPPGPGRQPTGPAS